jgi:hypothetical protein
MIKNPVADATGFFDSYQENKLQAVPIFFGCPASVT